MHHEGPPPSREPGAAAAGRVHEYRHRVRYFECDQQGVVFNMWYLGYFDEALGAFLGGGGVEYSDLIDSGYDVQLVHSEIDWIGPLRWGDEAIVAVRLLGVGTTSFRLGFEVSAAGRAVDTGSAGFEVSAAERAVATGSTVYVAIRTDGSGKVAIPPAMAAALGAPPPTASAPAPTRSAPTGGAAAPTASAAAPTASAAAPTASAPAPTRSAPTSRAPTGGTAAPTRSVPTE